MGRDIKGRNLGTGLSQRKSDKRYIASFIDSSGRRWFRTFVEFNKARQWLIDAKCDDHRNALVLDEGMTVNEWFEKWIKGKEQVIRFNTARNYKERYNRNVKKVIGRMRMIDVKSIHCQNVLNIMAEEGYAEGTVEEERRFIDMAKNFPIIISTVLFLKQDSEPGN